MLPDVKSPESMQTRLICVTPEGTVNVPADVKICSPTGWLMQDMSPICALVVTNAPPIA